MIVSHLSATKPKTGPIKKIGASTPEINTQAIQSLNGRDNSHASLVVISKKVHMPEKKPPSKMAKALPLPKIKLPKFSQSPYGLVPFDVHMSKAILTRVSDPSEFYKERMIDMERERQNTLPNEAEGKTSFKKEEKISQKSEINLRRKNSASQAELRNEAGAQMPQELIRSTVALETPVEFNKKESFKSSVQKSTVNSLYRQRSNYHNLFILK